MNTSLYISSSEFDCPTAIIKINRIYKVGCSSEELLDMTRGYWRTSSKKARLCDIVLSVFHGEVVEVYSVDEWVDGDKIKMTTRVNAYRPGSYGFNGHVAPKAIRDKYIGRRVDRLFKRGDRNPVRAFNVT